MIRQKTGRFSIRRMRPGIHFRNSLALLGLLAAAALAGRALAVSEPGSPRSMLGPDEPAKASRDQSAGPAHAGAKAKLTADEARDLTQALKKIHDAVETEHRSGARSAEVTVKRPSRTVTPPTLTSAEIDRLVGLYLTKTDPKVDPAPMTTDVEFVRRVYFDLIGKPPTTEQYVHFLRDRSHDKRARLIDHLLASPDWSRNWARYWRDVIKFHSTNENQAAVRFDEMEDWLAEQLRANRPWDEIATRMITATGRVDEYGAVSFPLAYDAQPVEMAGEVSRIFMGVQIQCAQCHDHKTDAWKQRQFHEFAAFFAGSQRRQVEKGEKGKPAVFEVTNRPRVRYAMPDRDNPTRQIPVAPRFFLTVAGSKHSDPALPESLSPEKRRELVASYITGQDNPWFARAFVNRTWYALMGESFYEPIDDMGPERSPRAPEVLEPLAGQWQKGGYDIRWLYRALLNTQAYQRRARSTANAAGKTPFASGCPSRLRADQIFEALVQALGLPEDSEGNVRPAAMINGKGKNARPGAPGNVSLGDPKRSAAEPAKKGGGAATKKALQAAGLPVAAKKAGAVRPGGAVRAGFNRLFGVDPSVPNDDILGTIPQALFMMNSGVINSRIQARPGTVLGDILASAPNQRAALDALYVRILSRQPTPREVEICGKYLAAVGNTREAFEDIYWSLINSTEFATRR